MAKVSSDIYRTSKNRREGGRGGMRTDHFSSEKQTVEIRIRIRESNQLYHIFARSPRETIWIISISRTRAFVTR